MPPTCKLTDCTNVHKGHGLCSKHLKRLVARGTTELPTDLERFWTKVDKAGPTPEHRPELGPCWVWKRINPDRQGYGYFSAQDRNHRAARWLYQHLNGPVDDALQLDHLCRNRACVRPSHLEPVTPQVNIRRSPLLFKAECARGHTYTEGSYYLDRGSRVCKVCKRARVAAYAARKRELRAAS